MKYHISQVRLRLLGGALNQPPVEHTILCFQYYTSNNREYGRNFMKSNSNTTTGIHLWTYYVY